MTLGPLIHIGAVAFEIVWLKTGAVIPSLGEDGCLGAIRVIRST
jgi:hypothetical protein